MMTRRIVLDLAVTLDGYIEGENGEVDWCIMDAEIQFDQFLNQIDTIFFGRKSYDAWKQYTSEIEPNAMEKELATLVQSKGKYVFSRTQKEMDNDVIFINDNIADEVNKVKHMPGKDIWLYGGANLITSFINLDLVDEFRLSVHPVVLGAGKPLFIDINSRLNLKLVQTKTTSSGVVQLIYNRINEQE